MSRPSPARNIHARARLLEAKMDQEFIPADTAGASAEPAWSPDLSFLPKPPPDPRKLTAKDAVFLREPAPERVAFYVNLNVGPPGQNWKLKLT